MNLIVYFLYSEIIYSSYSGCECTMASCFSISTQQISRAGLYRTFSISVYQMWGQAWCLLSPFLASQQGRGRQLATSFSKSCPYLLCWLHEWVSSPWQDNEQCVMIDPCPLAKHWDYRNLPTSPNLSHGPKVENWLSHREKTNLTCSFYKHFHFKCIQLSLKFCLWPLQTPQELDGTGNHHIARHEKP